MSRTRKLTLAVISCGDGIEYLVELRVDTGNVLEFLPPIISDASSPAAISLASGRCACTTGRDYHLATETSVAQQAFHCIAANRQNVIV